MRTADGRLWRWGGGSCRKNGEWERLREAKVEEVSRCREKGKGRRVGIDRRPRTNADAKEKERPS